MLVNWKAHPYLVVHWKERGTGYRRARGCFPVKEAFFNPSGEKAGWFSILSLSSTSLHNISWLALVAGGDESHKALIVGSLLSIKPG